MGEAAQPLRCSFCAKTQHEVRKLIAGPTAFICDECVGLCAMLVMSDPSGVETGLWFVSREPILKASEIADQVAMKLAAQGIEARSGETGTGSTEGESPVPNGDAPHD